MREQQADILLLPFCRLASFVSSPGREARGQQQADMGKHQILGMGVALRATRT
jgi:hypothetical protein